MIQLVRPSEKGVDNSECVNESVRQNAGPKVTTGEHVRRSQDQSCNAGINDSSRTFVIMPLPKQNRNEDNPDPVSRYGSRSNVSRTRQEIPAICDLLAKSGKRPHQQESNQCNVHVPGDLARHCRGGRLRPEKAGNRFDEELPKQDAQDCAATTAIRRIRRHDAGRLNPIADQLPSRRRIEMNPSRERTITSFGTM